MEHSEPIESNAPSRTLVADGAEASRKTAPWGRARLVPLYRIGDSLTESVLYFMVVFAPWAFGTTQNWSIWTMNTAGYVLGLLLIAKWLVRWLTGYQPPRWNGPAASPENRTPKMQLRHRLLTRVLAVLTVLILGYCFISAINARATFDYTGHRFDYLDCINWLPHSYDRASTWFAFWSYVALAFSFWAIRDWLLGKTRREIRSECREEACFSTSQLLRFTSSDPFLPARLTRLLWVLCLNGAILGLVSILQRLDGTDDLLWLIKHTRVGGPIHFGPYAYYGNAAQYFNLVWPVCIGFWWTLRFHSYSPRRTEARVGSGPHVLLLPAAVLIAACPIISNSRGGALICFAGIPIVFTSLLYTGRCRSRRWKSLFALLLCLLALGLYLGWPSLSKRLPGLMNIAGDTSSIERLEQYSSTQRMVSDYLLLGVGANAYTPTYLLYLKPNQKWYPYVHNDWLQTVVEWGVVGFALVFCALFLAWFRPVLTRTANPALAACLMISVLLLLFHAVFDFPLQIHSLLFTTLLLLALETSLPCGPASRARFADSPPGGL